MRKLIIGLYVSFLIGSHIGIATTSFVRPKGLWNLVFCKTAGWKSPSGFTYKSEWIWSEIDFQENPIFRRTQ